GGSATGGRSGAGGGGGAVTTRGPLPGPLRPSSNPRYFADANGRALALVGSHTWNNLQDWGASGMPQPLDFTAYTNFLVAHGHNFTLMWQTELAKFCG